MLDKKNHPCDLCGYECNKRPYCSIIESLNSETTCPAHTCFVNHEGICLLSLYNTCGCCLKLRETADKEQLRR